jgi:hypothetical protein
MERVRGDKGAAGQLRQNFRHVTGHALASGAVRRMMSVCLDGNGVRAVLGIGPMA